MKRYLLSFLAAYLVSVAVVGSMLLFGISQWLFTDTPLWFDILFVIVTALTLLAMGEVSGRRPKAKQVGNQIGGLATLLIIMGILTLFSGLADGLVIISWPGLLLGNAVKALFRVDNYWEFAFLLLGNLSIPCLFHLGWHWGTTS